MRRAPTYEQLPATARAYVTGDQRAPIYDPYATATWRGVLANGRVVFLKAAHTGAHPTLAAERDRCIWLAHRGVAVPEVIDHGDDGRIEWLVTAALSGVDATAPEHVSRPERTVPILAEGLRAFHEIDPDGCPFDSRVGPAIAHVTARVASDAIDVAGFHDVHRPLGVAGALARLQELRPDDRDVVVCHGDYCLPNVLLADGRVVGYLDLGEVGLADRWRDLAVATWSVTWNVGPGFEELFLDAYGSDWDLARRDFYRLLYDLES